MPNKYEIHIRRSNIMDDSFRFVLSQCAKVDMLKTKLWIVFDGEAGLDYGGVSRYGFYLCLCLSEQGGHWSRKSGN